MLGLMRGFFLVVAVVAMGVAPSVANSPLPEPSGRVILTVSGVIGHGNGDGVARFDRAMLEDLGLVRVSTTTSWTDGVQEFEGVLARDLLRAVGADGTTVSAVALNDYSVEIPISDFETYPVVFALRMNGVEMTARDKGPIWIVYPRDDHAELRNQKVDAKWIWQLARIVVR